MQIIPAIDIKGGKVVRLEQGAYDKETVYSDSPLEEAMRFALCGVSMIHVVDLDGACEGVPRNLELVKKIARSVKSDIELGGGLRSEGTVRDALDSGIAKVVLGTKALNDKFIARTVGLFGDRIVAGIDGRSGMVYTNGWIFKTKTSTANLVKKMKALGVGRVNYTDISRDGMLEGPNIESLKEILKIGGLDVIASGGISTIEDVKKLKALEKDGLKGIIIGKAIYEGRIELGEAIRVCTC